jgi:hypothetical protein
LFIFEPGKDKDSGMDNEIRIIELPKIKDLRGNLSFLEDNNHIPFKIQRTYWIYDVPGGEDRSGHAFKNTTEFVLPLSGGFTVETMRGEKRSSIQLTKPNHGLLIPPYTWRKFSDFLSNSICLVITDTKYNDCEYLWDYTEYFNEFTRLKL